MRDVLIGATEWQVEDWLSSFYPEDLPTEWQMSYYANEFSTTLLESHLWDHPEQLVLLAEMLEDCHDGFSPILSVDIENATFRQVSEFFHWLDQLDEDIGVRRMAGVLLSIGEDVIERSVLREWRECIPETLPVALRGYQGWSDADRQWLTDYEMSPVWMKSQPANNDFEFWLCDVSLSDDMRGLAAQVGEFLTGKPRHRPVCVLASSGYEDIARLKELSTIVRLING